MIFPASGRLMSARGGVSSVPGFSEVAAGGEESAVTDQGPPAAARSFSGQTAWARNMQTPLRTFLRTETGGAAVLLANGAGRVDLGEH